MSQSLGMPPVPSVVSRRIRWFVAATISDNVIEAGIALTEDARVSSTALIGLGLKILDLSRRELVASNADDYIRALMHCISVTIRAARSGCGMRRHSISIRSPMCEPSAI
ncbi:hypothetical protein OIE68_10495 [Nocardia vinacea]|uniref:Uncharacterized protein n=1 Tax=Nocardia vinacea TaxID=96468 RepID=A0ABZ1ZAM6_9NOCA|nr:hypothetical protein OIE68_10495 [Nocardia vinacea]